MSKKHKSSQFPSGKATPPSAQQPANRPASPPAATASPAAGSRSQATVKPEEMSLSAHAHVQQYLATAKKTAMDKEDLNAVLRLSQHLRVFGLLSAVAYLNQSNAQEGKTRERTVPVWGSLLGQLLGKTDVKEAQQRRELMEEVVNMAKDEPTKYMATWRKSLLLAQQWNFWARAYSEEK